MPLLGTARNRRLAALPTACVAAIGLATTVLAHAELVASTPAANAVLSVAPDELSLTFSEPIDPATALVGLVDPEQRAIEGVGDVAVSEGGLVASVPLPELAPGVYTISYQVVSAVDGHATAGILAFLVDPGGTEVAPTAPPSSSSPSVDLPTIVARWLGLASALVALGTMVMWWHAGRSALRDRAPGASTGPPWGLVGGASGIAFIGLSAYLVLSARPIVAAVGVHGFALDPAAPFGWTSFAIAMRIALTGTLVAAFVSLGQVLVARDGPRASARWLGPVAAALLLVALAGMSMAGHAAAGGGLPFAALDWIHLVAVAAWLGGIPAAFLLALRGRAVAVPARTVAAAILRRHGRLAILSAPIVALTGIANSPLVLGSGRDLVASDYGNLVLAKATLLAMAVGIGAVNHVMLRGGGRAVIGSLVALELGVALLAVGAAATMVTIQPAANRQSSVVTDRVNPLHLYGTVGPSSVHLSVNVPAPGEQTYQASVADLASGAPRDDIQRVFLELTPPTSSDLPPEGRVELSPTTTPGVYGTTGAYTPLEGEWTLDLVLRRRGTLDERLSFALPVTSPGAPEMVPPPDTGTTVPGPIAALWPFLPPGPFAWLPAILALAALWLLGRVHAPDALRWTARGVLAGVVLVAGAAAGTRDIVTVANAAPDLPPLEISTDPEALGRGEALFLANCASCHGRDGDGNGPLRTLPPAGPLAEAVRRMSGAELGYRIATGVAGTPMPAFAGSLTETERRDLVGYLRDRWNDE